jgi:shikimate dehydrogenase
VLSAATRVAAVIGDPVEHSLSPALHNAAFAALGLDWVYVAFRVPAGSAPAAVEAMRTLGLAGLSVTMPHKEAVAAAVDRLAPGAAALRSVNTVAWAAGELVGSSTDGDGFLAALADEGVDPAGRRCLVLGAGGAARAVAHALGQAGAARVGVAGRRPAAAAAAAALAGPAGAVVAGVDLRRQLAACDLVVNATPAGMRPGDGAPFGIEADWLPRGIFVADLVYHPPTTALIAAARAAGAEATNGLGMLVHQAARQVELWTGRAPPLAEMSAAALGRLGRAGTDR